MYCNIDGECIHFMLGDGDGKCYLYDKFLDKSEKGVIYISVPECEGKMNKTIEAPPAVTPAVTPPHKIVLKYAPNFLIHANILMSERGKTYDKSSDGNSERSMGKTVDAFNVITGRDLKESEGWLLMLLLKQTRQYSSEKYHEDSALDSVAYSALLAEALANES